MISVCMTSYNGEKYIEEQLKSILTQLSSKDEIVISDDGSKDDTCKIIKSLADQRIKLITNESSHGFTHNFENALRHAKGDYIFLSDQDDVWMDNKVQVVMNALQEFDFVTHDCITVDSNFETLSISRFADFKILPGFMRHFIKSRYLGCCMAFNRRLLDAALPFPSNDFLVEHDIWLAAIGFLYFKVKLIDKPLIYYRRHGKNVSDGGFTDGYSLKTKVKKRGYRALKLLQAYPRVKKIKKRYKP